MRQLFGFIITKGAPIPPETVAAWPATERAYIARGMDAYTARLRIARDSGADPRDRYTVEYVI